MAKKTGRKTGRLVPQPHGGAILDGAASPESHVPGPGRPRSALRDRLTGSFDQRVAIAEAIADDTTLKPADRLKAIDLLAKYGLGPATEYTVDHVRDKLRETVQAVREHCPEEIALPLLNRLRGIWT